MYLSKSLSINMFTVRCYIKRERYKSHFNNLSETGQEVFYSVKTLTPFPTFKAINTNRPFFTVSRTSQTFNMSFLYHVTHSGSLSGQSQLLYFGTHRPLTNLDLLRCLPGVVPRTGSNNRLR